MSFRIQLDPTGQVFEAAPGATLLQSALAAGIELPTSCRNGTCRTCLSHSASGSVSYRIEWPGLSTEEKEAGFILPCVAYPESDIVMTAIGN
jgi:ferredoxin